MSINFLPGNFVGETLTEGGKTWTWDGKKWNLSGSSIDGDFVLKTGDVMTGPLSIEVEATKDKHAVTKKYVDDKDEILTNQVFELEEEIDAIATSVGRGTYEWASGVSSFGDDLPEAQFYMVEVDSNGDVVGITEDYADAGKFIFHERDLDGNLHTYDGTIIDDILMMFDRPDPDFFEGTVTAVTKDTNTDGSNYYIIDVTHASSQGSPTDNQDLEGKYKARLNIFEAPTGGDFTFLQQGHLKLYRSLPVVAKSYNYDNYTQIPAESGRLNMTSTSFKTTQGFIMKDLETWYPQAEYDFVPGMVTVLEPYVSPGQTWQIEAPSLVWLFWAGEVKEWSPTRQRIQGVSIFGGNSKNSNEYPTTGMNYQVNFQCFRKK